jgi:Ca2+-binding EF-hand superfamily protein
MLRLLAAASTLAITAPVFAQDAAPMDQAAPQAPSSIGAPPADAPATPPAEAAPKSKADTVKEVVSAEFPNYDADKSGDLNKAEFGKWVTTLREQTMAAQGQKSAMTAPETASWVKNAFAKADTDKSKKVSQAELETFLLG